MAVMGRAGTRRSRAWISGPVRRRARPYARPCAASKARCQAPSEWRPGGRGGQSEKPRLEAPGAVLGTAHHDWAELAAEIADRVDEREAGGQRRSGEERGWRRRTPRSAPRPAD